MDIRPLIQSARPPFLLLTPICVFLGASTVVAQGHAIDMSLLLWALIGALCAHISVNTLNEYSDFNSGLDLKTIKSPFNGGSGALPAHPEMAKAVLVLGLATLAITIAIGWYFVYLHGWRIVPLGVIGALLIITYTNKINRSPFLCLIAPGVGFGLLMVVGTQFVLLGEYTTLSWLVGIVPFLLVNNLLLLNQYPDIEADKTVGRNHFPIAYGVTASNKVFALAIILSALTIITLCLMTILPWLSLIACLGLLLALFSLKGAMNWGANISQQPQYLASNVAASLLTPLLLGLSLIF